LAHKINIGGNTLVDVVRKSALEIQAVLNGKKNVLVVTHYNPDGDAIGSQLAMYHYLLKKGYEVTALVPNEFPSFLKWIPGANNIIVAQNNIKKAKEAITNAEVIFCIDFNNPDRLKEVGILLVDTPAAKVLIDHHPAPDTVFKAAISVTEASATAELVYNFIVALGDEALIDRTIAECLYTGIMTDTGCFNFNSSRPDLYNTVANLLKKEIRKDTIFNLIYDNFSEHRMRLMGYCLYEKMVVLPQYHAAYISLTKEEMEKYHFAAGDSEGFVNLPFSIKGVYITALFTEKKDHVRASFRSRGGFAINKLCEKYFNGGGHTNAAGGESKLPMNETLQYFESILEKYKNEITSIQWFEE
jgi:phosphoesterase RecJ-like protein